MTRCQSDPRKKGAPTAGPWPLPCTADSLPMNTNQPTKPMAHATADRKPAPVRDHNTYLQDNWTVADVEHVDRVFATSTEDEIRIDLDGFFADSETGDVGTAGENANLSVWMDPEKAKELASQLIGALPTDT